MAKTFFKLQGMYEGLRVRRLATFGRIVLDRVINDPPEYWFVTIRNFMPEKDLPLTGLKWGNGNYRFVRYEDALGKFNELVQIPEYRADEEKRAELARKNSERIKEAILSGKMGAGFLKVAKKEASE